MISQAEWGQLKESERYGMMAQLFKRVEELEKAVGQLQLSTPGGF